LWVCSVFSGKVCIPRVNEVLLVQKERTENQVSPDHQEKEAPSDRKDPKEQLDHLASQEIR
jgi:hypothetical protein